MDNYKSKLYLQKRVVDNDKELVTVGIKTQQIYSVYNTAITLPLITFNLMVKAMNEKEPQPILYIEEDLHG